MQIRTIGMMASTMILICGLSSCSTHEMNKPGVAEPDAAGEISTPNNAAYSALWNGDYATALRITQPLAEQGDSTAQATLGLMYATGKGVAQNYHESISWYRKAAEQGNAFAQISLGDMYSVGEGVPQDYAQAYWYSSLAAEAGHEEAVKQLELMRAKMTPAQFADVQERVREIKAKAEATKQSPSSGKAP